MAQSNTADFIAKAQKIHGDRYDYSAVEYHKAIEKVAIICREHGLFNITPHAHLYGQGCAKCGKIAAANQWRCSVEDFIAKANKIHGDKYDYSSVEYHNARGKVAIICREHGAFYIIPDSHLHGHGCAKCGGSLRSNTENFIKKARIVHGDKYDYSRIDYKHNRIKVIVVCREHGSWNITPHDHLYGHGCAKCGGNIRSNTEDFIKKARAVHGERYDYSRVIYKNAKTEVAIMCPLHREFLITPNEHLRGNGCGKCRESKGEKAVRCFLEQSKINYVTQHRFPSCKRKQVLPFDFILYYRGRKYAIEFHGKQHYCLVKGMFKKVFSVAEARANLVNIKERDRIKHKWCKNHKVPLLIIPYHKKSMIPQLITNFIGYDPAKIDFAQLEIE
jgi:hypothetical protein